MKHYDVNDLYAKKFRLDDTSFEVTLPLSCFHGFDISSVKGDVEAFKYLIKGGVDLVRPNKLKSWYNIDEYDDETIVASEYEPQDIGVHVGKLWRNHPDCGDQLISVVAQMMHDFANTFIIHESYTGQNDCVSCDTSKSVNRSLYTYLDISKKDLNIVTSLTDVTIEDILFHLNIRIALAKTLLGHRSMDGIRGGDITVIVQNYENPPEGIEFKSRIVGQSYNELDTFKNIVKLLE